MVKRRRLETPSTDDLSRIEAEFRSETFDRAASVRGIAPIAQVAADSASHVQAEGAEARANRARTEVDAARLHDAETRGLLMADLALEQIDEDAMIRDRMTMGEAEMLELRQSIAAHGLRLPIEVFELEQPGRDGQRYGLLSGYRRLLATRGLRELTQAPTYATIRAIIRPRSDTGQAFVSMIEENEVRENLSHFERGRIAVIAANHGAFANTEDAVDKLFATGSKAKRSKIRSFALIFEELGDMLQFPEQLTERRGLQLATALRQGAEAQVRQALSRATPVDADEEWGVIEPVIRLQEAGIRDPARGGRPKRAASNMGWIDDKTLRTSGGITIRRSADSRGHVLRLEGSALTSELMDSLMLEIRALLER
ncbi:ParB/RepB/Spo0J family partition protein [Paracoccus hibiscisoli]|uniref:Chromosome partitioning protein ParB n=1 Tax=Paracoccus hibiscisoli TaxID=2023261 RepID=A0A4U0QQX6_9RHOB|nr:ParB N-terminal domain-containing protein [Paracoccus hibiscisoli]TJZ84337.1 chromosome partitioning protein ParB [Paracoccus hibiscisoli]